MCLLNVSFPKALQKHFLVEHWTKTLPCVGFFVGNVENTEEAAILCILMLLGI